MLSGITLSVNNVGFLVFYTFLTIQNKTLLVGALWKWGLQTLQLIVDYGTAESK